MYLQTTLLAGECVLKIISTADTAISVHTV